MVVLYEKDASSFEDNGLCVLSPASCVVSEVAGGQYELELTHPFDEHGKYRMLTDERIIKAPVPPTVIPEITLPELKIWKTTTATDLMSKTPTTRYNNENWAILLRVKANPTAFAWTGTSYILYNTGAIALLGGIVYRALKSNSGVSPNSDSSVWQSLGSINDLNPIVDGGRVVESLAANVVIYKIANAGKDYIKVKTLSGKMGFVAKSDCEETVQTYQEVIPEQTITEQLFRIYETDCDEDTNTLVVHAKHVFYDMAGNSTYDCKITEAEPNEAIAAMQSSLAVEDLRTIACNITGKKITQDWSFKNPISALLDPDGGLVSTLKAKLIRNNDAVYILDAASPRTGITIAYGHNMLGVSWTRSIENVITRVIPRSGDADKGYMYIENGGRISSGAVQDQGKNYVESAAADDYHLIRVELMNCSYTVGEEYEKPDGTKAKYTEADVRAKMLEDALNRFTVDGVDGAEITLDVEFLLMGDTEEYKQYRGLQTVCLYDVITVKTGKSGIDMTAQVTGYEFDCLRKRYNHITVGTVNSFTKRVPGYKVVNESITYEKLSPDLINRILTANASSSTDSGSSGSGASGGLVTIVEKNSASADGIVTKGSGQASKVWKTDANGNPAWRDESAAQTVTDGDPTLAWGTRSKVGTVGNTDLHVTMPADVKVNRSGDTMTGNLYVEKASGSVDVSSENTTTSVKVQLKVGEGGANHGIYSYGYYNGSSFVSDPKWMITRTGTGAIVVNGDAATVNGHSVNKDVPSDAVFTDHYDWSDITNKPATATRWPSWSEVTSKPNRAGSSSDGGAANDSEKLNNVSPRGYLRSYLNYDDISNIDTVGADNYLYAHSDTGNYCSGTKPSGAHNGFGVLNVHSHSGNYCSQIGFDAGNACLWVRTANNATAFGSWYKILDSSNYTDYSAKKTEAIKNITRSGTTFTATRCDGTTFTFTQQDNDHYAWSDITGKPNRAGSGTDGGAAYSSESLVGSDTRSVNSRPDAYYAKAKVVSEFKGRTTVGAPGSGTYGTVLTVSPWSDASGGYPVQLYMASEDVIAWRYGTSASAWSNWRTFLTSSNFTNWAVNRTGDTMSGALNVSMMNGPVDVSCYEQETQVKVNLKVGEGGWNHGIYSYGYFNGSTFKSDPMWMIYRGSDGAVIVNGKSTDNAGFAANSWGTSITVNSIHAIVLVNANVRVQVWLGSSSTVTIWFERFTSNGTRYEFYKTGTNSVSFGETSATGTTKYTVTRSGSSFTFTCVDTSAIKAIY